MPASLPSLQDRLTAAQVAYDQLLRGEKPSEVEIAGGMRVTFTQATRKDLEDYISQLQAQLGGSRTRGAIGVIF